MNSNHFFKGRLEPSKKDPHRTDLKASWPLRRHCLVEYKKRNCNQEAVWVTLSVAKMQLVND